MRLALAILGPFALLIFAFAAFGSSIPASAGDDSGGDDVVTCRLDDGDDPPAEEPNDQDDWEDGQEQEEQFSAQGEFYPNDGSDGEDGDWEDPDPEDEAEDACGDVRGETFAPTFSPTPTFSPSPTPCPTFNGVSAQGQECCITLNGVEGQLIDPCCFITDSALVGQEIDPCCFLNPFCYCALNENEGIGAQGPFDLCCIVYPQFCAGSVSVQSLDVDCSGEVGPGDALLDLQFLAGIGGGGGDCPAPGTSGEGGVHGDADGDGAVDPGDVVTILATS